jgi:hypothetical protein
MYEKHGYNTRWVRVGKGRYGGVLICGNKSCETCSIRFRCFTSRDIELSYIDVTKMFNIDTNSCFVWKKGE